MARFGGDEFTILCHRSRRLKMLLWVAERVLEELQRPMQIDRVSLKAAASMGISLYPHDGQESATLLRNADQAMYRVKSNGRNGCQFFRTEMNLTLVRRPRGKKRGERADGGCAAVALSSTGRTGQ